MKLRNRLTAFVVAPALIFIAAYVGCRRSETPAAGAPPDAAAQAREQAKQQAQAAAKKIDAAREELEQIPPPAKSHYMAIHTTESWNNPFLIVGGQNVTLRVISPDQTGSPALPSAMLKPAKARRQELELRLGDLPDALGALPSQDWPYGRVIAVEEDPAETRANRLQVRRNVETTMGVLNNLGVVVYEWPTTGTAR
ncbi:hypothetical protein H7849_18320 [Alloacidobacterium dinghuense]|uniref:Uncharacterized protein n=1 Tax=Alloacidobacterium dinghuense TaxID=2763107 RepID=A0A7G8BES5_9BACT|nr:hypothetical protein [Alloacidobacterium dinghuense]QNI31045.1 hypothetical protein H7849_18320 [Alloacidobacterium dinghuense]